MAYLTGLSALGVDQAVFTGMDGLVIEALGQGPPSAEALAAELAALARRMDPLAQALGGKVLRFTLATEDREVLAVRVGEFLLGAVVHRGLNRKAVGQELSRIALRLEEAEGRLREVLEGLLSGASGERPCSAPTASSWRRWGRPPARRSGPPPFWAWAWPWPKARGRRWRSSW